MNRLPRLPAASDLTMTTDRLELRPLRREHAALLFPVLSEPALYEYTGELPPRSVEWLRELFASREARTSPDGRELWLNWGLWETGSGEVIGYVQATVSASHADVAWVVGTRWQGLGYGSESARALVEWLCDLGVLRIQAGIHPDHRASQAVAARVGLRRTHEYVDGEELWTLDTAGKGSRRDDDIRK